MAEHSKGANKLTLEWTSSCKVFGQHQDRFAAQFKEREAGCGDLTIILSKQRSKVHRTVLMENSDYFKSMFSKPSSEIDAANVDLSNSLNFTDVDDLNIVFDYMYTGNISLSEKNITSVLNVASLFLLTKLKLACAEFLMANIVPSTCISILALAEQFCLKKVKDGCIEVIKAWFSFYLCRSKEALGMAPDCLKVLVTEKVFDLVPNDVMKTFMQQWYTNFQKTKGKKASLPTEVTDLLKVTKSLPKPGGSAKAGKADRDEVEEVLLTMVVPRAGRLGAKSVKCVEILAFSPKSKMWKSVLCHTFTKNITRSSRNPDKVKDFIGITEEKAYFVFDHRARKKDIRRDVDGHDRYVVAVDLKSKRETVIGFPESIVEGITMGPKVKHILFLWGSRLCLIFNDGGHLNLYFSEHMTKCSGTCMGECWDQVCELPSVDSLWRNLDLIATKVVAGDLYVGVLTRQDDGFHYLGYRGQKKSGRLHAFCVSQNANAGSKCSFVKLPSPGGYKDMACDTINMYMSNIHDPESSTLVLSLRFEVENVWTTGKPYELINFVYDLGKAKWVKKVSGKATPPESVPRVLEATRKVRSSDSFSVSSYREREVFAHGFYARCTSPFNTNIWKRENKQWLLITHAPCPVTSLAHMQSCEMRKGFCQTLPNASFVDYSREIRQGPVRYIASAKLETDFELEYPNRWMTFGYDRWASDWGAAQKGPEPEQVSSESESSDEEYVFVGKRRKMKCAFASDYNSEEDDDDDDVHEYEYIKRPKIRCAYASDYDSDDDNF